VTRSADALHALAPWIQDWITSEQRANDRVSHRLLKHRFALDEAELPREYWPEQRPVHALQYALLDADEVMQFGPVQAFCAQHFGFEAPRGKRVLFVHPGNLRIQAELQRAGIARHTSPILCTPTSSFRSLLCWHPSRPEAAAVLKLALHVRISGVSRHVGEREAVGSVYESILLRTVPPAHKQQIGFEVFDDVASSYCAGLNLGQILRSLPPGIGSGARLVPAFSLGSMCDGRLFLRGLVRTPRAAQALVHEMIAAHVKVASYLMFHEGISHEFHPQNVLFEVNGGHVQRVVLRDFYRSPVRPVLRAHRGRPMPEWPDGEQSALKPLYYLYVRLARRAPTSYVRVFGIRGLIWEWARALRLFGAGDRLRPLQQTYLRYWQEACAVWIGVWPKRLPSGPSLALNEAIDLYLAQPRAKPRPPSSPLAP
jgi:hypothetical protein